jgi:hypothetical protein
LLNKGYQDNNSKTSQISQRDPSSWAHLMWYSGRT